MKKIFLALGLLAVAVLFWYLYIKQYDYQFHTTVKNSRGILFSEISEWKKFTSANNAPDDIRIINREPFTNITQRVLIDSSSYFEMHWELEQEKDSVTALTVKLLSTKNTIANRWSIVNPFKKSVYLDSIKGKFLDFQYKLQNQQKFYKILVEDLLTRSPETICVCSTSTDVEITNKAMAMVNTIDYLETFVIERDLKLNGYPFLKVTRWDREKEIIDFDFCFPISNGANLEDNGRLSIKKYSSFPALKAVFNGNYRLSHIAWYEMLFVAEQRDLQTDGLPLEIFHNNPKTEENPTTWTTEIFFPVND